MPNGDWTFASLVSAFFAVLGGGFALFRYVQSEVRRVFDHSDLELRRVEEHFEAELVILETNVSKARHEKLNEVHVQMARFELTLEQLRTVAVRREEMLQMETRVSTRLEKMETKLDRVTEALPMIVERLEALKQLQRQMISRNERVDKEGRTD